MTGRLLTAREVAGRLGVSVETVLRWVRRGELRAIRLPGGQIRFREEELEAWIEERATSRREGVSQPDGRRPLATLPVVSQPSNDEED